MSDKELDLPARDRAIALVLQQYGDLRDLPEELAQVVWVVTYRASLIGHKLETNGGQRAILKNMLIEGGNDTREFVRRTHQIKFLKQMVPIVRAAKGLARRADAQLTIDFLKWNMIDVAEMSTIRRLIARKFAKADPMYNEVIPLELLSPNSKA